MWIDSLAIVVDVCVRRFDWFTAGLDEQQQMPGRRDIFCGAEYPTYSEIRSCLSCKKSKVENVQVRDRLWQGC